MWTRGRGQKIRIFCGRHMYMALKEAQGERGRGIRESIVEGQSCRSVESTMRKIRMRRGSSSRTHKDTTLFDSQEKDATPYECLTTTDDECA